MIVYCRCLVERQPLRFLSTRLFWPSSPAHWCVAVLLVNQLIGCVPLDSSAVATKQVQMVNALTLKFWSDPYPLREGENSIYLEVNAPTRIAMVNRDVLLTYPSAEGTTSTVPMQPVPGKIDVFRALIELDAAATIGFLASVQSPTKPPATAHFYLPVVQVASTTLSIEGADN